MKNLLLVFTIMLFSMITINANAQSVPVTKTNPTKVYVHYMPWFTAPENPGTGTTNFGNGATGTFNKWGGHWSNTGSVKHPDNFITVTDYNGQPAQVRDICAHFHPLIGPYNGKDTAVLEYHTLLMKLSGIDGVMIDWYGKAGNGAPDAGPLLDNSNALIKQTDTAGLKFSLIVEDAAWKNIDSAINNGAYIINNYFSSPNFITIADIRGTAAANASAPLLGVFGPQKFKTPGQWNTILNGKTTGFLPLFNQSAQIGADAGGEFAWPYPQAVLTGGANAWFTNLSSYYQNNAGAKNIVLGTAFPGFKDFYGTNGASVYGVIPRTYNGTTTLSATLALYTQRQSVLDGIQLATWNDFSEGTIIEPTVEEGFQSLDTIQRFTGVPYTEADLKEVFRLFTLRKKYANNPSKQLQLNQVFTYFNALQIADASALMDIIDNVNAPQISVIASGTPSEDGATGTITISGTKITSDLTVNYTVGGTRGSALYTVSPAFTGTAILTAAVPSVTFTITAIDDAAVNQNKTVTLKVNMDDAYNIIGTDNVTLAIVDNEIPPCAGPVIINAVAVPIIDGAQDTVWSRAPINLIGQTISGIIQTGSTWQAMYDANNLYILVQVKDSTLSNIGTNDWDQDGVEIYLAGNNSKAGAYTANDHQYRFDWNTTLNIQGNTGSKAGIQYAMPTTTTGYNLEVAIPWTTIGGTPPTNFKLIGFDININDQHDNAGQRESTAGWNGTAGDNYQNTTNFGSVPLTICTGNIVVGAPFISSVTKVNGKEYNAFVYTILASDNPYSYTALNLPAGLTINTSTGLISGTPSLRGVYTVTVTATNAMGTDTKQLVITIDPTPAVSIESISAERMINNTIQVLWTVNNEINIAQYQVQRSTDNVNFTTVNTITSVSNSITDGLTYVSIDESLLQGDLYYRIKGVSANTADDFYFSDTAKINRLNIAGIYPNPLTGNYINIPFNNLSASRYTVRLVNYMGQVLYNTRIAVDSGNTVYTLRLNRKPAAGAYQLELKNEAGVRTVYKVLVENK